jgi:hypothetical protein
MSRINSLFESFGEASQASKYCNESAPKTSVFDVLNETGNEDTEDRSQQATAEQAKDLNEASIQLLAKNAKRSFWTVQLDLIMNKHGDKQPMSVTVEADSKDKASRFVEDNFFSIEPQMLKYLKIDPTSRTDSTVVRVKKVQLLSTVQLDKIPTVSASNLKDDLPFLAKTADKMQRDNKKTRTNFPETALKVVIVKDEMELNGTSSAAMVTLWDLERFLDDGFQVYGSDVMRQPLYLFEPKN